MHEGHPGLAAAFLHALRSLPQMRGQSARRHLRAVRCLSDVRHVSERGMSWAAGTWGGCHHAPRCFFITRYTSHAAMLITAIAASNWAKVDARLPLPKPLPTRLKATFSGR